MEYQKIIGLLDGTTNQPSKLGARNWVETYDESEERMIVVKLNLKLSWWDQIYVIILIHTCMLKEL